MIQLRILWHSCTWCLGVWAYSETMLASHICIHCSEWWIPDIQAYQLPNLEYILHVHHVSVQLVHHAVPEIWSFVPPWIVTQTPANRYIVTLHRPHQTYGMESNHVLTPLLQPVTAPKSIISPASDWLGSIFCVNVWLHAVYGARFPYECLYFFVASNLRDYQLGNAVVYYQIEGLRYLTVFHLSLTR